MYHHLLTKARGEYWRQRPDKRLDHPPQRATVQEPSVIKDKFEDPKKTSWWSTASVHAERVNCLLIGWADRWNVNLCLSSLIVCSV